MKDNNYDDIIKIIKDILNNDNEISVNQLINSRDLANYEYENKLSLTKYLLSIGLLELKDQNSNNTLESLVVRWNKEKNDFVVPKKKILNFNTIRICITLPPFNISGLINQMKKYNFQMNSLVKEFSDLFLRAKTSIKICSPFLEYNGFAYFEEILINKVRQGVKLQILSRQIKYDDKDSRFGDFKNIFKVFLDKGLDRSINIRNYYFQSKDKLLMSSIHAKMILIDDYFAYIGSGEIRKNSFKKNLEIGIILSGSKVSELVYIFDKLFSKSEVMNFV
ncbi:MAG: hypothetical protein JXA99_00190 [Candidatus Lokiarchaeota archaeon]|nr:hypothetical protein [Candidatus Lokiarchaeota archaeon]